MEQGTPKKTPPAVAKKDNSPLKFYYDKELREPVIADDDLSMLLSNSGVETFIAPLGREYVNYLFNNTNKRMIISDVQSDNPLFQIDMPSSIEPKTAAPFTIRVSPTSVDGKPYVEVPVRDLLDKMTFKVHYEDAR